MLEKVMTSESNKPADDLPSVPMDAWVCECCGRSLDGLRLVKCPDCGFPVNGEEEVPVSATIPPPAPLVTDLGGAIPECWNLHCQRCGYNLTGLTSRVCPECGEAFHPRRTWLANRRPSSITQVRKVALMLAFLLCWAVGVWCNPFWLVLIPPWAIMELLFCRSGRNPFYLRVFFITIYVLWALLLLIL